MKNSDDNNNIDAEANRNGGEGQQHHWQQQQQLQQQQRRRQANGRQSSDGRDRKMSDGDWKTLDSSKVGNDSGVEMATGDGNSSGDECDIAGHHHTDDDQRRARTMVDVLSYVRATAPLRTRPAKSTGSRSSTSDLSVSTPSPGQLSPSLPSSSRSSPSPDCDSGCNLNDHHHHPLDVHHHNHHSHHPPSMTLSTIRDAVSHLTRLDDFNVIKLSQGFFSQVFKVTHKSTKKVMVLKMNKQAGNRVNALKEIELLNKLNHENIVGFMGTVVHEGQLHPLLEYINGGTLEKLIRQYYKSPCPVDGSPVKGQQQQPQQQIHTFYQPELDARHQFVSLAKDIARGMDYLHSMGYIHRDLTSKNVLIRRQDRTDPLTGDRSMSLSAVIGDFGFANVEPSQDQKLPTVGSPYWLGPECLKGQWYNHKCDVFSFGVISCELNWLIPADPDYLPRNGQFLILFDKLPADKMDSILGRTAQLACQGNPSVRPEFYELLELFESAEVAIDDVVDGPSQASSGQTDDDVHQQINGHQTVTSQQNQVNRRPLLKNSVSVDLGAVDGDIFDQHLIRRNSQIEMPTHRFRRTRALAGVNFR